MKHYDYTKPLTTFQFYLSWVVFVVVILAIFHYIPPLVESFETLPTEPKPGVVYPPAPPADAEVTDISTYPTSELRNMRASVTVRNTGTEVHSYHVTLETASTHTVISVWDVPPGGLGSNDGYLSTKDGDLFVVNRVPDLPLEVVNIHQF